MASFLQSFLDPWKNCSMRKGKEKNGTCREENTPSNMGFAENGYSCRCLQKMASHLSDDMYCIMTDEIDEAVHQMIIDNGAYPSPLGYGNFPKSVCTSVNECICHGIPDSRPLEVLLLKYTSSPSDII
ncbi:hypothetical protein K1719_037257 [Acacia pycnantha]|nr:hypothetical protein K1719_037257 [Acacia pycnantha]